MFSIIAREGSPSGPEHSSASDPEYFVRSNGRAVDEQQPEGEATSESARLVPAPPKLPLVSRRRVTRFFLKPSDTLKLSPVAQGQLMQLQERLAQFGAIKLLDTTHIAKGYRIDM